MTVTDETYTYDSLGNRLSAAAVSGNWLYNLNNELNSYGTTTLTHDANGNITKKSVASVDTTYVYDEADRMEEVTDDNGVVIAAYYYDPFGRRLWKNTGSGRTYYLYSDEGPIGEYDSSGTEIKTYGYTMGSQWGTNPLFQKVGSDYYWYHNDHQGTPQKITDTTGTVVWSATYDSFGKATTGTETITNNLRFPGQYCDTETGLHYNWNRYYDPETGRYMRVDPVGEGLNLYLYVQNNPLRYIDPKGLKMRNAYENTSIQAGRTLESLRNTGVSLQTASLAAGIPDNFLTGDVFDSAQTSSSLRGAFNGTDANVYAPGMFANQRSAGRAIDIFNKYDIYDVVVLQNRSHFFGMGDVIQAIANEIGVTDITQIRAETVLETARSNGVSDINWYAHSQWTEVSHGGFSLANEDAQSIVDFVGMGGETTIYNGEFGLNSVRNVRAHGDPVPYAQHANSINNIRGAFHREANIEYVEPLEESRSIQKH